MEQTRPVIAVDLDEVLGYFVQSLARWHNEAYGTTYTQSHFFSYTFKDVWGGTAEESTTKVHAFFESDYFQQQVAPVPGALEALQQLKQRYQLVIVTSRQHSIEEITRLWVAKHYPDIFDEIHFGNHWGVSGEKISKPDMCKAIHARVLVDDALHYAKQCAGLLDHVILFGSYAWNQSGDLPSGVSRAEDWAQAVTIIDSLNL
eukprot:TRINITY_DN8876_c0_g1_i2.p1 TRINITY_DN8876_c0_g1~~TRINITY_DN8876_c0_g1_i2.p1  ORF type:complete len:203 (+),score=53.47 TRINITY_DN8876_c0_g1_i2:71-679(+)